MAEHISTFSGVHFAPLAPHREDILVADIAHALSLMTRANGHFPEFYSVAQHCLDCAAEAKAEGLTERSSLRVCSTTPARRICRILQDR